MLSNVNKGPKDSIKKIVPSKSQSNVMKTTRDTKYGEVKTRELGNIKGLPYSSSSGKSTASLLNPMHVAENPGKYLPSSGGKSLTGGEVRSLQNQGLSGSTIMDQFNISTIRTLLKQYSPINNVLNDNGKLDDLDTIIENLTTLLGSLLLHTLKCNK